MKMLLGGKWVDASNGQTIDVLNSATQEKIDTVPSATVADVQNAIANAQKAKDVWAAVPQYERSRILQKCADLIEANVDMLAKSLSEEMGKIIREARPEIAVSAQIFRGYAEKANHLYGETMNDYQRGSEKDLLFTRRQPLGIVACISPFNYPVELCSHKVAAALTMGNAVIVKPASDNPLTLLRMFKLFDEAGIPDSVLQVLTGSGAAVGSLLAESDLINAISLTGSTEVGISVAKAGASSLKRVFLELGGNDPFIVLEDANMEAAVEAAVAGRVQNAGQTCCAPKRFIVQNSVRQQFTQGVLERLQKVRTGSPLDENTDLGSLISVSAAKTVEEQVAYTVAQGAKLLAGGKAYDQSYFQPTVLGDVTLEMDIARDLEVFGPVIPIIGCDTIDDAIAIANATCYGLQGGVMTRDMKKALYVASRVDCGSVVINGSGNFRNVDQPFGGFKKSGLGREGITCTLEEMSQEKTYILKGIFA